jgi:2'-5' RNA ligase
MPRLFLGTYLDLADQSALAKLPQLNPDLEIKWNCRIKWSKPEQLHLTWIFFGNVDNNKIDDLRQAITEAINSNPLNKNDAILTYKKLECWFNHKVPKVLALTPNSINANLLNFAKLLRTKLSKYAD